MAAALIPVFASMPEDEPHCASKPLKSPSAPASASSSAEQRFTNQIYIGCPTSCCPSTAGPSASAPKAEHGYEGFPWEKLIDAVAKLAQALAWPIAGAFIALRFKQELATLLARLRKGKIGGAEFEFEREVQEVEEAAEIPRTVSAEAVSSSESGAPREPRGAIVAAWIDIENALFNLVQQHQANEAVAVSSYRPSRNVATAIRTVEKWNLLGRNYISLFHDLRSIRNEAAHAIDFSPSSEALIKYLQLARELRTEIERAAKAENA